MKPSFSSQKFANDFVSKLPRILLVSLAPNQPLRSLDSIILCLRSLVSETVPPGEPFSRKKFDSRFIRHAFNHFAHLCGLSAMYGFGFNKSGHALRPLPVEHFVWKSFFCSPKQAMFRDAAIVLSKTEPVFHPCNCSDILKAPCVEQLNCFRQIVVCCPQINVTPIWIREISYRQPFDFLDTHKAIMSVGAAFNLPTAALRPRRVCINCFILAVCVVNINRLRHVECRVGCHFIHFSIATSFCSNLLIASKYVNRTLTSSSVMSSLSAISFVVSFCLSFAVYSC
nr:MAG TPA: hypothetical protein [Caudoviricetes sp.]